ncbi:glycerol-3-phosphate 1-O-acyltransferase PlsY [Bacillus suaedaesalsae]|uniref:Glycerol-3-phosphate acyltransferase n=1 Tax=Bacillus suaedaesalsae TaxID=2810349 RepID=A0ABS2DKF5_9BACI|nr:glycerol-3-phosphate 1-O-acyltransferase PlsY [Bacillus suaedaesalsae]MBM6618984.1 glycerol-3-phosphate 1-O-acyltransferase PlsY [Bacillus suaedaesalsae]
MLFYIPVLSYLIGSIPFALIVGKVFFSTDVRKHGSGNLGATNSIRILGKRAGAVVMICDILKGIVATLLPILFNVDVNPMYIGFIAVIGHCFPIFAGFKGGKAVATTFGVLVVANPLLLVIALGTFIAAIFLTKFVAIGSISIGFILFVYSLLTQNTADSVFFLFFSLFLLYLHRSNLKNITAGTEPKVNDKNLNKDKVQKK